MLGRPEVEGGHNLEWFNLIQCGHKSSTSTLTQMTLQSVAGNQRRWHEALAAASYNTLDYGEKENLQFFWNDLALLEVQGSQNKKLKAVEVGGAYGVPWR